MFRSVLVCGGRSRAPFFNDTTKYVVSGTLTNPTNGVVYLNYRRAES